MANKSDDAARILARAEKVERDVHIAQGALQARRQELEQARRECEALGLNPDQIDGDLLLIDEQIAEETRKLQAQVEQAERVLQGG